MPCDGSATAAEHERLAGQLGERGRGVLPCDLTAEEIFRYPVVVGGGTPFLPPVTEDVPLDLIESRTFGSRVIYERYGRAVLTDPDALAGPA